MLIGFGVTGYRSFGPEPQFLHPLDKVNLIVGKNNVGKSNVLRLVQAFDQFARKGQQFQQPSGLDAHLGDRRSDFAWLVPVALDRSSLDLLLGQLLNLPEQRIRSAGLVRAILSELGDVTGDVVWVPVKYSGSWKPSVPLPAAILGRLEAKGQIRDPKQAWYLLWNALASSTGGSFEQHHGPLVMERLLALVRADIPRVSSLNAHRQIGAPGTTYQDLNGQGLIARLLELQNPELAVRGDSLAKFAQINTFVAEVLDASDARLEVPHSGKELNVSIGNRVLPVESLGTGVHEVIIFAAAATSVEEEVLCIEEPEIHLHPRLQRQLLRYLQERTSNQYFITTHSACLLDSPGAALFHVTLNEHSESELRRIDVPKHRAEVGFDLGYRASDLVQANSIVWVEGPSDRIYLNAWIQHLEPMLSEGLHYSVMFYGGRLLSHLSADDESVTDFVSLQRLNRHVAIVIDSDKRKSSDSINQTKQRVLDEIEKVGGFGWVTGGREIENYIGTSTMSEVLKKVHPRTPFKEAKSKWDCAYEPDKSKDFSADKVAIARAATDALDLGVLDLRLNVERLVKFINDANR